MDGLGGRCSPMRVEVRLRGQNHEKLYSVRTTRPTRPEVTADMFEQCELVQRLERLEALHRCAQTVIQTNTQRVDRLERQLSERLERLEVLHRTAFD
jgi:hypothetical protein